MVEHAPELPHFGIESMTGAVLIAFSFPLIFSVTASTLYSSIPNTELSFLTSLFSLFVPELLKAPLLSFPLLYRLLLFSDQSSMF